MKRVFVVEDHEVMRHMLRFLIEREPGLELCGDAASGSEALKTIPRCEPDLVLVDVSLPGMSGIELARHLNVEQPHIPVLVITGHDEAVYAEQAFSAGARGFVTKGYPAMIMPAAHTLLSGQYFVNGEAKEALELAAN
jgi:DNA-binding NarL/FixJ family response regulator